jgi:hypothetical protein
MAGAALAIAPGIPEGMPECVPPIAAGPGIALASGTDEASPVAPGLASGATTPVVSAAVGVSAGAGAWLPLPHAASSMLGQIVAASQIRFISFVLVANRTCAQAQGRARAKSNLGELCGTHAAWRKRTWPKFQLIL